MPRLSDMIQFKAMRSSLDVTCQANPKHITRQYFAAVVDLPHAVLEPFFKNVEGVMPTPQIDMRICPQCMVEFMGDVHKEIENMQALM